MKFYMFSRLTIRPTDRRAHGEYWVAIAGTDIDWATLSNNSDAFIQVVRDRSGLYDLQFKEFLTLSHYRYSFPFLYA